jgi:UPF0042 nucleotide-binding protein
VVIVVDIRGTRYFGGEIEESLDSLRGESGWRPQIIFLESDDRTLVRRYKESRRPHPAATNGDVLAAIQDERRALSGLREIADVVVDTSALSAVESKRRFARLVESEIGRLSVSLLSFGFKHGTPLDVDMLLDVRFLPNPHYDPELRPLTGHDEPVRAAVLGQKDTIEFLAHLRELLTFRRQDVLHLGHRLHRRPAPFRCNCGRPCAVPEGRGRRWARDRPFRPPP